VSFLAGVKGQSSKSEIVQRMKHVGTVRVGNVLLDSAFKFSNIQRENPLDYAQASPYSLA
jgi:hypothetical protein